jgi:methionyl aminopeptidase
LHEYPTEILPFYDPSDRRKLTEGMVITIEPFISTGAWKVDESNDGWTLKTPKHYRSAQFEHTMIITTGDPIVVTHHV